MLDSRFSNIKFKDLLYVILFTGLITFLGGIAFGYIDYFLIVSINFTFSGLLFWIVTYYLGKTVRKAIEKPHLIYSIIAGIGMVLTFSIIDVMPALINSGLTFENLSLYFDLTIYFQNLLYILNPVTGMSFGMFNYLITILILVVGTYLGIQQTKFN